jgi:hypothetical protein
MEDARTWIEETGLCLFLPRRQFAASTAPSFVEAVAGRRETTPDPPLIAEAEAMLVRLELDGVAVRLNLLGQPGDQPDFVVASWVLPYVYALRGDRDWRRSPQLTGSRQVSPLAIQAYKILETGETTLSNLKHTLGREVSESAVLRAITELWQQLRIIPVVAAPGDPARWQLLRQRFQKAIAEGASTSQVTAISVLASIYLQAVIAASMEEVELFLSPLTARSKVREVLRGLVATRQVHTIALGHAPHFYVAGTLPEFSEPPSYATTSLPSMAYYLRHEEQEEVVVEPKQVETIAAVSEPAESPIPAEASVPVESHPARTALAHKPSPAVHKSSERTHFSHSSSHARDRKPATASQSRTARSSESRSSVSGRSGAHSKATTASGSRLNKTAATAHKAAPASHVAASRKPALASAKSGAGKRFAYSARPASGTKKRG